MINILSFLNVSNISNLESDSGFIFQKILLTELAKTANKIYFITPKNDSIENDNIFQIEYDFPEDKYGVRFGFAWNFLEEKIKKEVDNIDIILMNQSELTVPFSLLLTKIFGKKIPIITYFHYIAIDYMKNHQIYYDDSLNHNNAAEYIWNRQKEALLYSDYSIVGSNFGLNLLKEAVSKNIKYKIAVIPPPVKKEIFEYNGNSDDTNEKVRVIYNHRLYNHYGGMDIFDVLKELSLTEEFEIIITDPTHNRSKERNKLDRSVNDIKKELLKFDFVKFEHLEDHNDYLEMISKCDFGISPLRKGGLWSMSIVDIMSVGKPVLSYDYGSYREIVGDEDLLFTEIDEFKNKFVKLIQDKNFRTIKGIESSNKVKEYSSEKIGEQFMKIFRKVLKN